jgi:hypothetical protein
VGLYRRAVSVADAQRLARFGLCPLVAHTKELKRAPAPFPSAKAKSKAAFETSLVAEGLEVDIADLDRLLSMDWSDDAAPAIAQELKNKKSLLPALRKSIFHDYIEVRVLLFTFRFRRQEWSFLRDY